MSGSPFVEFASAVKTLGTIVTHIRALVSDERALDREVFDEFYRPIYDDLAEIHAGYTTLFSSFESSLPLEIEENLFTNPGDTFQTIPLLEASRYVERAKQEYIRQRKATEGIRDKLRYEARDILLAAGRPESQRFMITVIQYFLSSGPSADDPSSLSNEIESVLERGGSSALETPASTLLAKIRQTNHPTEVLDAIHDAKNRLNRRLSDVSATYTALRVRACG